MIADWEWIRGELKDAEAGHRGINTYLGVNIFNWQQGCSTVSQLLQDLGMLNGNSQQPNESQSVSPRTQQRDAWAVSRKL